MKLSEWLYQSRIKRKDFALMVGVSAPMITRLCDGSVSPSLSTAQAIERETAGQVRPQDFMREAAE